MFDVGQTDAIASRVRNGSARVVTVRGPIASHCKATGGVGERDTIRRPTGTCSSRDTLEVRVPPVSLRETAVPVVVVTVTAFVMITPVMGLAGSVIPGARASIDVERTHGHVAASVMVPVTVGFRVGRESSDR